MEGCVMLRDAQVMCHSNFSLDIFNSDSNSSVSDEPSKSQVKDILALFHTSHFVLWMTQVKDESGGATLTSAPPLKLPIRNSRSSKPNLMKNLTKGFYQLVE